MQIIFSHLQLYKIIYQCNQYPLPKVTFGHVLPISLLKLCHTLNDNCKNSKEHFITHLQERSSYLVDPSFKLGDQHSRISTSYKWK